jgi:hypothetical protein
MPNRKAGWFWKSSYKDATRFTIAAKKIMKAPISEVKKSENFRFTRRLYKSYGIPTLAKVLEKHIIEGRLSEAKAKSALETAVRLAQTATLDAIMENPQIATHFKTHPADSFDKQINLTPISTIGSPIIDPSTKHAVLVGLNKGRFYVFVRKLSKQK